MSNRALLTGATVIVALLAIVAVTLVNGDAGDDAPPAPTTDSSTTTSPPIDSDDDPETAPAPPEAHDPEEIDPDLSGVATDSPETVATAWACAYWSHPRGETAEQLAARLSPLSTPELIVAVSQLRMTTVAGEVVSVIPGATEPGADADTYVVGCQTVTTAADGSPTAPTAAHNTEVRVTRTAEGWRVAGATVGGLTLPAP